MSDCGEPRLVKAEYNYKGANNDELNFSKGDVITVTQIVEGGWWEGTLNAMTGWFPSNFVKDLHSNEHIGSSSPVMDNQPQEALSLTKRESMLFYHTVVLQSFFDGEKAFVADIQSFMNHYLKPLHIANVITTLEWMRLSGNLEQLVSLHQQLLQNIDECAKLPVQQQRVGGIFLKIAPELRTLYIEYCSNHPNAASILQAKKNDLLTFLEANGANSSGIDLLTTNLSKPFTRLDKYPSLLKELERYTDVSTS